MAKKNSHNGSRIQREEFSICSFFPPFYLASGSQRKESFIWCKYNSLISHLSPLPAFFKRVYLYQFLPEQNSVMRVLTRKRGTKVQMHNKVTLKAGVYGT